MLYVVDIHMSFGSISLYFLGREPSFEEVKEELETNRVTFGNTIVDSFHEVLENSSWPPEEEDSVKMYETKYKDLRETSELS